MLDRSLILFYNALNYDNSLSLYQNCIVHISNTFTFIKINLCFKIHSLSKIMNFLLNLVYHTYLDGSLKLCILHTIVLYSFYLLDKNISHKSTI